MPQKKIQITFPDSSTQEWPAGVKPIEIAQKIGARLAKDALAAKVNGKLVDLNFPIEENAKFEILTFDSEEGKHVYWHSSSHIMAAAIKNFKSRGKKPFRRRAVQASADRRNPRQKSFNLQNRKIHRLVRRSAYSFSRQNRRSKTFENFSSLLEGRPEKSAASEDLRNFFQNPKRIGRVCENERGGGGARPQEYWKTFGFVCFFRYCRTWPAFIHSEWNDSQKIFGRFCYWCSE